MSQTRYRVLLNGVDVSDECYPTDQGRRLAHRGQAISLSRILELTPEAEQQGYRLIVEDEEQ